MSKQCCTCKETKPLDQFHRHARSVDGRVSRCKVCAKEFDKTWFQRHQQTILTKRRKRIQELLIESRRLKEQSGCILCGEDNGVCLDWHHKDPDDKDDNISQLIENNQRTKFYTEIVKCVTVCANCHRKIHAGLITLVN